ncbi:MAG: hypothetical protein KY469_15695 [Actinobacteria bacterium]|nr:hypothetical protein [Actinomycetota bacterium]
MRARRVLVSLALAAIAVVPLAMAPAPLASGPLEGVDPTRVFPDPLIKGDFIQLTPDPVTGESEYLSGLAELEELYPDAIEVDDICDLACEHLSDADRSKLDAGGWLTEEGTITSVGGHRLTVITVTDEAYEDVPVDERIDLYFSMSIHGNERAGLEGSLRFIEDLAIHLYDERQNEAQHLLRNGDPERPFYTELTTTEALRAARLVFVDLNPDGWADGDRWGGQRLFKRGNDNGIDLNRQWPTLGWHSIRGEQYRTMSQPEAIAGRALIEGTLGVPEGAADLHGENHDNVLLAIMFPAGEFDPGQLAGQVELAEAIKYNVNNSVHPGAAGLLSNHFDSPVYPAEYHTAYDAIGYDDSGFQGDYLVQQGILEMDHEYIFSNIVPSSVFVPELEQVHVDTTRALLEATLVTTIQGYTGEGITYTADLGDGVVAYVHNPEILTDDCQLDLSVPETSCDEPLPATAFDLPQQPYTSTSMRYYEDLAPFVDEGSQLVPVPADAVAAGDLDGVDTLVITNRDVPRVADEAGNLSEVDTEAFWPAVKAFAEGGGTVVLTDEALEGLETMGVVPADSVTRVTQYAGEVKQIDTDHPLLTGVGGVIGQTYFEVPMGYAVNTAPAYRVDTDAWEAAGGTTAAVAGSDGFAGLTPSYETTLGSLVVGDGKVTVFGAILPDGFQGSRHTHGLADYAVTYAGNAILVNALAGL